MTKRSTRKHIESLLQGRRPERFAADPDDAELIRTAITLQSARRDLAEPREEFMSGLFDELAAAQGGQRDGSVARIRLPRRIAVVSAAAAAVLIGGTFGVTEAVDHRSTAPAAVGSNAGVHSSVLLDAEHHAVGRINLYRGSPSWVFMTLSDDGYDGPVSCQLLNRNGSIALTGVFQLTGGQGEWARTINVNLAQIQSARIVAATGTTLATASFS